MDRIDERASHVIPTIQSRCNMRCLFRRTATGRNASSGPLFVKTTVFHSFFLVVRFANVFQRPFFLVHVNYFFLIKEEKVFHLIFDFRA